MDTDDVWMRLTQWLVLALVVTAVVVVILAVRSCMTEKLRHSPDAAVQPLVDEGAEQ